MDNHQAGTAAIAGFLIGGIVSALNSILGFATVVTAAFTGAARYIAVLRGADRGQIERATAWGFVLGVMSSAVLLALDRL